MVKVKSEKESNKVSEELKDLRDKMDSDSKSGIGKVVSDIVKNYSDDGAFIETGHVKCDMFDTGNIALNFSLSGNFDVGYPEGHVIDLAGDPSSGKSFLVKTAITNFLKKYPEGVVILDDTENSYVDYIGSKSEIDHSRLIRISTSTPEEHSKFVFNGGKIRKVLNPDYQESGKEKIISEIEVKPIVPALYNKGIKNILVAVDSIAAWSTEHEIEVGLEKPDLSKAKVLKAFFRIIKDPVRNYKISYFITNHMISKIGEMFGPTKVEGGGGGPAYAASVRLSLEIAGKIKSTDKGSGNEKKKDDEIIGVISRAITIKNRFAPPFRSCGLKIMFNSGLDRFSGLPEFLLNAGLIKSMPGGWYSTLDDSIRFQAKDVPEKWDSIKASIVKR